MKRWEYHIETLTLNQNDLDTVTKRIINLGQNGWELVSVSSSIFGDMYQGDGVIETKYLLMYFKRNID